MNDSYDDVVKKLADLDVHYLNLHREWIQQKKVIEQLKKEKEEQFNQFWEACVKLVGEDIAYVIVGAMPDD